jgi:acyl-coenzyme A synthetase/AMP-(fatty) acid ligase
VDHIGFLLEVFDESPDAEAVIWRDTSYAYGWFRERVGAWIEDLADLRPGSVVALEADFSPNGAACLLALIERGAIIVPVYRATRADRDRMYEIAEVEHVINLDEDDQAGRTATGRHAGHELYQPLRDTGAPGLVLFSSGTSGDPKGAVHYFDRLLEKFKTKRPTLRTINFLLFDHIGGVNTLLHTLSNAGTVITVAERDPDSVCATIARHHVELLPTSPTFLNLLLLSEAHRRHDLSSLKLITYGTEPMPPATLERLRRALPEIKLLQTYGLAELGILRSRSRSDDSLWVKIGGEGFDLRVVDGILQIKASSAMLGYLNAPSPFTEDGYFITGDEVLVDGEYFRILGRRSEMINVGGQKVYPAEVEGVIQLLEEVVDATVYGEPNPIVGSIVCARVTLAGVDDPKALVLKLKRHCRERLETFKVPVKVVVAAGDLHGERYKKLRGGFR